MADDILSLRLDPTLRAALDRVSKIHGITVSDLLRLAADHVTGLPSADVTALLACPGCKGTGRRYKTSDKETP